MERFWHPQLTPHETYLQLDGTAYTITLLQAGEIVTQHLFTEKEWRVLTLFFREQGIHCTYAEALAAVTGQPLADCQKRLSMARQKDAFEESVKREAHGAAIQVVRELVLGCQGRLHALGLHIAGLLHHGYVMCPYGPQGGVS